MDLQLVERRYKEAVDTFTESVKADKNVIAVMLYGSLSYDKVWEKSDIDMVIVVRDQKLATESYCIDQDDIVINAQISTRSDFIKWVNTSVGGLFGHALLSKARFLYTVDESLNEYLTDIATVGTRDMGLAAFALCGGILGYMKKVEKWIRVKNDPSYARYYLFMVADCIAKLEVCTHREPPTREAILRAAVLNPSLMERFFYYPLNNILSEEQILQLLQDVDEYIASHLDIISEPVLEYLSDGEPKTITMLTKHFKADSHGMVDVMDYLRDKGLIEKITQTIRITPKGRPVAEEIAYLYIS